MKRAGSSLDYDVSGLPGLSDRNSSLQDYSVSLFGDRPGAKYQKIREAAAINKSSYEESNLSQSFTSSYEGSVLSGGLTKKPPSKNFKKDD